jgi:Protein of unknown function (DUF669)
VTNTSWADLIKGSEDALRPVPDGEYNVKIVDAREDKSSSGKLMIRVKFEIQDGPSAPRKVPTQLVLSTENQVAVAIFFRQMEAMGLDANFFAQLPPPDGDTMMMAGKQIADALFNRTCRVTLKTRAWQGVDRNEVAGILPSLGGGPVAPGTVTGVATPGGPVAPGATTVPAPTSTPATPATASASDKSGSAPPLPF